MRQTNEANMIIKQNLKNFNIGLLKKTKVTASSGLLLILKFAEEIGLFKEIDKRFSHLKERDREKGREKGDR